MKRMLSLLMLLLAFAAPLAQAADAPRHVAGIDELLALNAVSNATLSPDGKWIAYTVSHGDFKQDAFVTQIWLIEVATQRNIQLTRGEKSSTMPRWSPNGEWLAFLSNRLDNKDQLFVINPLGGEAVQLTKAEGVTDFAWSEDGRSIAFTATEPVTQFSKDRKEHLGDFEVTRKDYKYVHLWTLDLAEAMNAPVTGRQRTRGTDFSVNGFSWSPDGSTIAFSAQLNPDLIQGVSRDIYLLKTADNSVKKLVAQPGPDSNPRFSPDGKQIVFSSAMGNPAFFHSNSRLAIVSVEGGTPRSITDSFDEDPDLIDWKADGIYFNGLQKTARHLFRVDPASAKITRVSTPDHLLAGGFSLSRDARRIAFTASSPAALAEVFVSESDRYAPRALTHVTEQTRDFIMASREMISWKSTDGTVIEGVLIKPADFDPGKKYPLLCIIHGGPTSVDRPSLLDTRYYPSDIWAARGALVLKVNYRGSAGYGEKFRELNVRNLGVGDAWDVISGIDYLVAKGWVDKNKVASMGWSQGGYISAFLTASSDRFVAISVGAGISDWATQYYNSDIPTFEIQYLGGNPVDDPAIYRKTSPVAYIKAARTPTLIQHGELDRRVPIANAYELRQALEDRGVKVEMIVYKGLGHGITKPKSLRAVMEHNVAWFNHYIWGDPLRDFTTPALPQKDPKDAKEDAPARSGEGKRTDGGQPAG